MLAGYYWAICLDRETAVPEIVCVSGINGQTNGQDVFRFGDDLPWKIEHFRFTDRLKPPAQIED